MRIAFNLMRTGLGNNGGSRTIIRCAETLNEMGHSVFLVSEIPCKYTWHSFRPDIFCRAEFPVELDAIIATGCRSVPSTLEHPCQNKWYYIRGLETWNQTESELLRGFAQIKCLVNSRWLQRYLRSHRIPSEIVYPGLDYHWFYDAFQHRDGFGAIYHKRHKTKNHDHAEAVGKMIGTPPLLLNKHVVDADPLQMWKFYNQLKVWFAPTVLEGLHNPPMEAALCGCALVCSDAPRGGMEDYAIHKDTAMVYPSGRLDIAAEYVRELLTGEYCRVEYVQTMRAHLSSVIGTRRKNMAKLVDLIS